MTLLPSRKLSAAFVGVFLIGGLVGGLLVMAFTDMKLSHFMTVTSDPQSMATRVNQKYVQAFNLNADEQARIAPLIREMTQHLYLVRRQFGVDIIATLDDYHQKIGAQIHYMFLPVLCYMIESFATLTILMKNSLMENLGQDYVRTAYAKGLSERRVIFVHALRNSLISGFTCRSCGRHSRSTASA